MLKRYTGVVYVNGELKPAEEATVSVFDHGLLYGDGVFDTMFAKYGYIFKLEEHIARFRRSMRAIALEIPLDQKGLSQAVLETTARNGLTEAYIKIIATRGRTAEPLLDPRGAEPTLIILVRPYLWLADPSKRQAGLKVKITSVRRVSHEAIDPRIKNLNYLNLVLAKIEALNAGCDEALLLDQDGMVSEAPGYNVFMVVNNVVMTPDQSILEGITRETIFELCRELGIPCVARPLAPYDFYTADEAFLTATAVGMMPITRLDGRQIGSGTVGPVFQRLDAAYDDLQKSGKHGTRIPITQAGSQ